MAEEVKCLVDNERIHEKHPGGRGRPPAKKRDVIKSLLLLELLRCQVQKSSSLLNFCKELVGLNKIPAPSTLYKYRALPGITSTLERLQMEAAREPWMTEKLAATDSSGNPRVKGKTWRHDRTNPKKYRDYDKAHYIVGLNTLVIPATRVTRGTWSDIPEFEPLVRTTLPGSNIEAILGDCGYVSLDNYAVARELGVTPYIKPKDNAVFRPRPSDDYERMVYFATRFPKRFNSTYRWRVKAECTIHSKKSAFGDIIRGRLPSSRRNQEICRDIVHNLRMSVMMRYAS